jgi:nucleoside-diphosphate-sugar epimerase
LSDRQQLAQLPDVPNIVLMTGMKFGATGNAPLTWMMNVMVPGQVCERFARSRIVVFSTGNVYGLSPVVLGGSLESDALAPVGEYAITAVGRERICTHISQMHATPMALLRLNYAQDLRYGVLVDIARQVWAGEPVRLAMGCFNALWQGDANAMALSAFAHLESPPKVLNLAGPDTLSVRRVAESFGRLLNRPVSFDGVEASEALLSNGQAAQDLFGYPRVGPARMIKWIAGWIQRGGEHWGKPTHFENRAGAF